MPIALLLSVSLVLMIEGVLADLLLYSSVPAAENVSKRRDMGMICNVLNSYAQQLNVSPPALRVLLHGSGGQV